MSMTRIGRWVLLAVVVGGCGSSATSTSKSEPPVQEVASNSCGGCQVTMGNTCMRILGAAVDRPGVTVANLCDPWCCELTQTEFGDVGYVHNVSTERWATCPDAQAAAASAGGQPGSIEGAVVEDGELLVPRATVVVSGVGETTADTTGEAGRYRIDNLVPGNYTLTVYYGDVVFKKQCVRVLPGETHEFDVNLAVKVRADEYFIVER